MKAFFLGIVERVDQMMSGSSAYSFGRVMSFIVTSFVLGWDTHYVRITGKLPDVATMAGQVAFMTAFYVSNKVVGAYTAKNAGANQPQETQSGTGQQQQQP